MSVDTLSDVLCTVRLRGAVFYYVSCGDEWAAAAPPARDIADAVFPGVQHVMEYHVVPKGTGWAGRPDRPAVRRAPGDIAVFPHGDAHWLASGPDVKPSPADAAWFYQTRNTPKPIPVCYPGLDSFPIQRPPTDPPTKLACGFFGCDVRPFNPLVANLPRLLHLPASGDPWSRALLTQAMHASQAPRPGSDAVLERISEMMFVDAIRRYVEALPAESTGWLAGLRDRHVGRALSALHADPSCDWTIDALAREAALSRSALYDRFVALVGHPPMQYLTQWRMQVAARLLHDGDAPVAAVALEVGYDSEAAFARAFKRQTGSPPAAWRRASRAAGAPARTAAASG